MNRSMHRRIVRVNIFCCVGLLLAGVGGAQTFFTDVTEQVGLERFRGDSARTMVFVDYDNDGLQDVFLR